MMYRILSISTMKLISVAVVFTVCLGICTAQDRASYAGVCQYSCSQRLTMLRRRWSSSLAQRYYGYCMARCQDKTDVTTRRPRPSTQRTTKTTTTTPRPTTTPFWWRTTTTPFWWRTTTPTTTTTTTTPFWWRTTTPTTTTTTTTPFWWRTTTPTTTTTTPFWWRTTKSTTTTRRPSPSFIRCGMNAPTNRIVGGRRSDECEFPWMVYLLIAGSKCGGTIIDEWHILSAAHCFRHKSTGNKVDPSEVKFKVGSSKLANMSFRDIDSYDMNPNHVRIINDYDLVVVTLRQPLTFGTCIQPICLPDGIPDVSEKDTCFVAGWGVQHFLSRDVSPDLRKVELPLVNQSICNKLYIRFENLINPLKLCAGNLEQGGVDACSADSGGPYMCQRRGVWYQFGIVSTGFKCAIPYRPGIYTRVAHPEILNYIQNARKNRN